MKIINLRSDESREKAISILDNETTRDWTDISIWLQVRYEARIGIHTYILKRFIFIYNEEKVQKMLGYEKGMITAYFLGYVFEKEGKAILKGVIIHSIFMRLLVLAMYVNILREFILYNDIFYTGISLILIVLFDVFLLRAGNETEEIIERYLERTWR